jgi:hypothetical protein
MYVFFVTKEGRANVRGGNALVINHRGGQDKGMGTPSQSSILQDQAPIAMTTGSSCCIVMVDVLLSSPSCS